MICMLSTHLMICRCLLSLADWWADSFTLIEGHECDAANVSLRAPGAAGPPRGYHQPVHNPPHLEEHPIIPRVSPWVEGERRSGLHVIDHAHVFRSCIMWMSFLLWLKRSLSFRRLFLNLRSRFHRTFHWIATSSCVLPSTPTLNWDTACVFFLFSLQAALVLLILWWFYSLQEVVSRASPFRAVSPATTWRVLSQTLNISSPSSRCTRVVRRPHLCPLHPEVSDSTRGQTARDL